MKNFLIATIGVLGSIGSIFGQEALPANVNPCGTYEKMEEMEKDPAFKALLDLRLMEAESLVQLPAPKGIVYKIPIVFHVLHDGGVSNISREQILDALNLLNQDFRGLNPDINDVATVFQGLQADSEIEFVLATKAPDGSCFNGITRTYHPEAAFDGNSDQVGVIRDRNDVYNGDWPGDQYLNVFIVGSLSEPGSSLITLGYTTYPAWGGLSMDNGFHVIHQAIGTIGTGGVYGTGTSTHEIGHWLNLAHTWGSNNNPGEGSCDNNDNVDDTPSNLGIQGGSCNPANPNPLNSCSNDNAFWGFDIQDNVENYMDYAHCDRMFSLGQKQRMRDALTNTNSATNGGRNNLWTAQNLIDTGADGNIYLCKAEFSADKRTICNGDQVQFTDESFNVVSGWNWSFPGGVPATSTSQNPLITYSTPGLYEVTLTATDGTNTVPETKTAYIRVLPDGAAPPYLETFENYGNLTNLFEWDIFNEDGTSFELETTTGHTGTKCARLSNFGQEEGWVDEMVSLPLDLTAVNQLTFSFRYSYKRRNTYSNDWLRVKVSKDCGETWAIRKTLHGQILSSAIQGTPYTPVAQTEWITVHMTNITSDYWVDNFMFKFNFESGDGNNFYLDNINVYAEPPTDNLIVGLEDLTTLSDFTVFPNPSEGELNVQFALEAGRTLQFEILDLAGKVLRTHEIYGEAGNNLALLDVHSLASGMYMLQISGKGVQQKVNFVVR